MGRPHGSRSPFPSHSSPPAWQKSEQPCSAASGCSCQVAKVGGWVSGGPLPCRPTPSPLNLSPKPANWGRPHGRRVRSPSPHPSNLAVASRSMQTGLLQIFTTLGAAARGEGVPMLHRPGLTPEPASWGGGGLMVERDWREGLLQQWLLGERTQDPSPAAPPLPPTQLDCDTLQGWGSCEDRNPLFPPPPVKLHMGLESGCY